LQHFTKCPFIVLEFYNAYIQISKIQISSLSSEYKHMPKLFFTRLYSWFRAWRSRSNSIYL